MKEKIAKARPGSLLEWTEIEAWQRDNEYIVTSYRRASPSYVTSLRSILSIHNETTNIWTHLLGALLFVYMLWLVTDGLTYHGTFLSQANLDHAVVGLFCLCTIACFFLSTSFHTLSDHSSDLHRFGNQLDHLGIVLVMWGTGVTGTYFGFYCDMILRNTYFVLLTSTAFGCGIFTLKDKFRQPTYRTARFLLYVFLGASLFAPVVHGLWLYGWETLNRRMQVDYFLGLAVINFTGSAVYAARIPERWFPRTFDLVGQSHNWMHVLVFTGALVRFTGLTKAQQYWSTDGAFGRACHL